MSNLTIRRGPRRIASSVALQKLIYFESFWSVAWWLAVCGILLEKYMTGLTVKDPDEVRTIFIAFFTIAEPLKLLAGYYGNLKEQVPLLAAMVLLSVVPLLPASAYLLIAQEDLDARQQALQVPQLVFHLLSIGLGSRAIRRTLRVERDQEPYTLSAYESQAPRKTLIPMIPNSPLAEGAALVASQLAAMRTQKLAGAATARLANTLDEPVAGATTPSRGSPDGIPSSRLDAGGPALGPLQTQGGARTRAGGTGNAAVERGATTGRRISGTGIGSGRLAPGASSYTASLTGQRVSHEGPEDC